MPVFDYRCNECDHEFDELRSVDERQTAICPNCGGTARLIIRKAAHLDYRMGVSHDFPTAADRWAKIQRSKNTGKIWDSNNERYGGSYDKP